jgi:hypothetical protein
MMDGNEDRGFYLPYVSNMIDVLVMNDRKGRNLIMDNAPNYNSGKVRELVES